MNQQTAEGTRYERFLETHERTGWCSFCDREVPITPRPHGHARMWFCALCARFLGEEPRPEDQPRRPACVKVTRQECAAG